MKQIEKYKGLLDMINGGGANAEGDKFQGGGLLSILANALATPRGSEDRAKEEALAGLLGNTRPNMRPNRPASIAPAAAPAPAQSPLEMFGGQQPAPYSPTMQGSGMTPANNYVPSGDDPFSYSRDALYRDFGMAGNIPTPGRYDFGLPDDANDFGINPNVAPNPFAGSPGVGGDGRSLDGEILRDAPTGLPEVPSQDAAPSQLEYRDFVQQIKEKYPNRVNEILRSDSVLNIINYYNQTGVLPVIGPTP